MESKGINTLGESGRRSWNAREKICQGGLWEAEIEFQAINKKVWALGGGNEMRCEG